MLSGRVDSPALIRASIVLRRVAHDQVVYHFLKFKCSLTFVCDVILAVGGESFTVEVPLWFGVGVSVHAARDVEVHTRDIVHMRGVDLCLGNLHDLCVFLHRRRLTLRNMF